MARMRSLKPEFWLDRKLARSLSRDERMLYLGLWNQADEWARANGDARVIKGQVFPFDDDITLHVLETMLKALAGAGVVQLYEIDGDPYLFLPKLAKHQRLEPHKVPSRHPEPPEQEPDQQFLPLPEPCTDESAHDPSGAQTSPRGIRAKHVAGSREHVAGGHGADESAPVDHPASRPKTRTNGTRIPDDFAVTDEMRQWATENRFDHLDLDKIITEFRDYWAAESGQRAVKRDWVATWRNRVRAVAERSPRALAAAEVPNVRRAIPPWEDFG